MAVVKDVPAIGSPASITLAADPDGRYHLRRIVWSYGAVPVGGRLTVDTGGVNRVDHDITTGGKDALDCDIVTPINQAVVITLAGIATVQAKLTVIYEPTS